MNPDQLPIHIILDEFLEKLRQTGCVILQAPTGAGKTTRIPPAIVEANLSRNGQVLMLEPRRVAARAAANRMAREHGSALGETIGYHVRLDRRYSKQTKILTLTPGILLRRLQDDPFLDNVQTVIFDEFHERGLEADLALGLIRLLRLTVRPDLQLVVMSATFDADGVSRYLDNSPIVTSAGRSFPVTIQYQPKKLDYALHLVVSQTIRRTLQTTAGNILVFLPGLREIRQCEESLADLANSSLSIFPLHGDLPAEQQDRVLQRSDRRKIILSTNIAETSVTIEGVTVVIDSGLARQMEFDGATSIDRLRQVPISQASADQRSGRAGRTAPGVCIRLWDEPSHRSRPAQTIPEVLRVDLSSAVLSLQVLGEKNVRDFPWFEKPNEERLRQAEELLQLLGAIHDNTLTPMGRHMASFGVHPRLARMLIEGHQLGVTQRVALAAAILAERDPFWRQDNQSPAYSTSSDVLDRVEALEEFARTGQTKFPIGELQRQGAQQIFKAQKQFLNNFDPTDDNSPSASDESVLRAIFAGYPDRLAKRRGPNDSRAKMLGGRGVKLLPQSGVTEGELFVCVEIEAGASESSVRLASRVEAEWLPENQIHTKNLIHFDESTEKIRAVEQRCFAELVLSEKPITIKDDIAASQILAEAAIRKWESVRPSDDSEAGQLRTRIRCVHHWMKDIDLPNWTDAELQSWLPELCRGIRSLEQVRELNWHDILRQQLSYPQGQLLTQNAPESIIVPSGSAIKLDYEFGRSPILAVRIQELFGLADTPRIAGGQVKVILHLLAPNYRPQQITDDLASFWQNGYPLVRKDLRGRYPKHSWPENPLEAEAIRGTKKRKP